MSEIKTGPGWRYSLDVVPKWCQLPPSEHQDGIGGCWGISHGLVEAKGEPYCVDCEFYAKATGDA